MGVLHEGEWREDGIAGTGADGRFRRGATRFRNWITPDGAPGPSGRGGFAAESGRYHLYVSLACPWAHRTLIFRALKGLAPHVSVDVVHPVMGRAGWTFDTDFAGATGDRLHGARLLREVYLRAEPRASGRVTVPVLWDRATGTIVSNESAEIIRMFDGAFGAIAGGGEDLCPPALLPEIDAVNARVYDGLNDGVYRAGFAAIQAAYDEAAREVFATLDWLESRLAARRFLVGDRPTEADWRLAPTLFRFDAVYHGHFKCNRRRIVDYPNLWAYARSLHQWPGVADTLNLAHVTTHYYASHRSLNPSGVVPIGPDLDWSAPHGR
jgi:putative glutathione S-transferase